jgi:O-antigen/teichoic acid export membrane protein
VKRRRLSRDIAGIFGTRATWSVLGLIGGVILARKLGPYDRGILSLVLLLPETAVTFVKLGITQANVYFINREQRSSIDVASNSTALALIVGTVVAGAMWLFRNDLFVSVLRGVPTWALAFALVRVPLILLDGYLYGVLQAVGRFDIYNTRLIVTEVLRVSLIAVTLLVLDMGLFAAVVIHTAITLLNITWLVTTMRRSIPFTVRLNPGLLRQQLVFGLKSYAQTVTQHGLLRADVYMISYFLNPAETAFYSLALRFTELILEIPQAVGLVLYPRLALAAKEEIHILTAQACRRTLLITGTCAVAMAVLGPYIITLWYGPAYAPAGVPLPWAAVGVVAMSVFSILTRDFTSRNLQRINIAAGVPALLMNLGLNVFMIPWLGIVGAAMATAISYSVACAILLVFYLPSAKLSLFDVLIVKPEDLRYFWNLLGRAIQHGQRRLGLGTAKGNR